MPAEHITNLTVIQFQLLPGSRRAEPREHEADATEDYVCCFSQIIS